MKRARELFKKGSKLRNKQYFLPIAYCRSCRRYDIVRLTPLFHKEKNIKAMIASCVHCDNVLNLEKDLNVRWITLDEAKTIGWDTRLK